jgi:hypothetical protein
MAGRTGRSVPDRSSAKINSDYVMLHKLDEGMRNRTIMSIGLKPKALTAPKA